MGVARIGIFGSVAKEVDGEGSDVDLLVEFLPESHNYRAFNQVCDMLDEILGLDYDIVTPQGLSPYLRRRILEEVVYVPFAS